MRRKLLALVGLYLLLAVGSRVAEALGFGGSRLRCACVDTCWCKQPGPSLFRWVTPASWHQIGHGRERDRPVDVAGN
jgi:hypothetical protein